MQRIQGTSKGGRWIAVGVVVWLFLAAFIAMLYVKNNLQGPNPHTDSAPMAMTGGAAMLQRNDDFTTELFGRNVYVFSPEDDPQVVQDVIDRTFKAQETNQFGDARYGFYFLPGTYSDKIRLRLGFYTEALGLGVHPTDTRIGPLWTDAGWEGDATNHKGTCNFWRGLSNLELQGNSLWAVSQATWIRRAKVDGNLTLHDMGGWVSGGFIADSYVTHTIDSGSQQQWLTRNSAFGNWMGQNWNMVFLGDEEGCDPKEGWPTSAYTSVAAARTVREKPYLYYDEAERNFCVAVPSTRYAQRGTSWGGSVRERSLFPERHVDESFRRASLDAFYIARAEVDTAETLNQALTDGKNLYLTPGVYELEDSLKVRNAHTIILGSGLATLRAMNGNRCIEVGDLPGVILAGILLDAGPKRSDVLLVVGQTSRLDFTEDPITLSDVFVRIGGVSDDYDAQIGTGIIINANDTITDNLWIWRADHGDGVAWDRNVADTGLVVNGDRVSCYGLMVEHFEDYQTIWNGNEGQIVMYQSELPYDAPEVSAWTSHDGKVSGCASIKISDPVDLFEGIGIGIYSYNRDSKVEVVSAIEVPENKPGVTLENVVTVMLNGHPGISNVVNQSGGHVYHIGDKARLLHWPIRSDFDKQ